MYLEVKIVYMMSRFVYGFEVRVIIKKCWEEMDINDKYLVLVKKVFYLGGINLKVSKSY